MTPEQNNYCGLGATGRAATADELLRGANPSRVWFVEGKHGAFFDKPATGIEAQMQHLYAYATTRDLPPGVDLLSPRYILVTKGIAPNWEDLGAGGRYPAIHEEHRTIMKICRILSPQRLLTGGPTGRKFWTTISGLDAVKTMPHHYLLGEPSTKDHGDCAPR